MTRAGFFALFLFSILASAASAQQAPQLNPVGTWRCASNSDIVSIDMLYQVGPDYSVQGQGSIVYTQTSRIFQIQGQGSLAAFPPDASSPEWLLRFQLMPMQGHAMFSVFGRPTQDPNYLQYSYRDPQSGILTQTSCARVG